MTNPYKTPESESLTSDAPIASETPTTRSVGGIWYFLLIPASVIYTVGARELAGPGYTTAPNQGAMALFFLASLAWPLFAIVVLAVIRGVGNVRGTPAVIYALVAWVASCAVPFLIGMK